MGGKKPKEERKADKEMVGFLEMYRYAQPLDKVLTLLGVVSSMINGAALPLSSLLSGTVVDDYTGIGKLVDLIDSSIEYLHKVNLTYTDILKNPSALRPFCHGIDAYYNTNYSSCDGVPLGDSISESCKQMVVYYCALGVAVIVAAMGQTAFFSISAERQANRIRRLYFANILRQDIGWFDTHDAAELNSRLSGDMVKIQNGLGDRVATAIQHVTTFVAGYTIGFIKGWKLTLVLVAVSPVLIAAGGLFAFAASAMTYKEQVAYAKAGAVAEEVLSSVRTVLAFGGEEKEYERYKSRLGDAQKLGAKKGLALGVALGSVGFANCCSYALGLWYAGKLIRSGKYTVKEAMTTFFAIVSGTFALGLSASGIQSISEGRGAAFKVFQMIKLKSKIDSSSTEGKRPNKVTGAISFQKVHFSYPSRPDVKVLSSISVEVKPGQAVAVVGSSGCGKSTLVQLLMRFYDPQQGTILLDGQDIKNLNIKWLRQAIGLVSQEPILFDTTIAENIRYGRDGVTEDEIIQATKDANAYDFIAKLPNQLNTLVGEGGAQLSGGQKQRIAIARALVRDPKILLLDEATSALDTESESVVQDALDKARQGRTTLVIAHRLSTIKTADIIIGLDGGKVKEKGTHSQLMEGQGIYYNLFMSQSLSKDLIQEQNHTDVEKEKKGNWLSSAIETKPEKRRLLRVASVDEDQEEIDEELPQVSTSQLLRMNSPEWFYMSVGLLGAVIYGAAQPAFGLCFSEILSVLSEDYHTQKHDIRKYSLYLVGIGGISFVGAFIQSWNFAVSGEALTRRLREGSFKAMLRQEMAWFDKPCNSTGALINRLATDASVVQGAAGTRLGVIIQCLVVVGVAVGVAFFYSWQLTMVAMGFFPMVAVGGVLYVRLLKGNLGHASQAPEDSAKVAVDALVNMRTVAALSKEDTFMELYSNKLKLLLHNLNKNSFVAGFLFSFSQSMVYFSVVALLSLGAYLVEDGKIGTPDVYRVLNLLLFTGAFLGHTVSFGTDVGKAKAASRRIFYMLQRKTRIDVDSSNGAKPAVKSFTSSITVHHAGFSYPLRPEVKVLQDMTFTVRPGQTVALVGSSGCGKSTVISLLERFYNLDAGSIVINNYDITKFNIRWLRAQIGLVSQEPVLFDSSIADNIAYGDNSRVVPINEIVDAARQANVHSFIQALPLGYDTNVGEKGTQLSGGQKQRIAIARALVRNPKILLLDEATSALDTESEKVVQEALDKARQGRTCIIIAHRLSTIQDADNIIVMRAGQVVEQGTHDQLLALNGFYATLQNIQNS